jgi:hypothetical protein
MSREQPDPIYLIANGQKRPEVYAGCDVLPFMLDQVFIRVSSTKMLYNFRRNNDKMTKTAVLFI